MLLISALFGLILGIVSGILPGVGASGIILMCLPVFLNLEPEYAFVAYLSLVISSQYVASITAIYTGIPGAESSVPTSREFANIRKYNLENTAIIQNARSSIVGNIVGISLFLLITPLFFYLASLYKNDIRIGILTFTYLIIVLISDRKLEALILVATGTFLMTLGYNENTFQTFDLGLPVLSVGVPWITLVMGSLMGSGIRSITDKEINSIATINKDIKTVYLPSTFRGSLIGFFVGFIPGLSYILSSIFSYLVEKRILREKQIERKILGSLAASESAHSSGILAMLIPLLVFGIPITASEGVILNIISIKSTIPDILNTLLEDKYKIVLILLTVNLVSYFLAMKGKLLVNLFFSINKKILKVLLFAFGLIGTYYSLDYSITFGLFCYLITFSIFYIRDFNPLPFIISVILFPSSESSYYLFLQVLK